MNTQGPALLSFLVNLPSESNTMSESAEASPNAELTQIVIGAAMRVLNVLKPGLNEKLYERALIIELAKQNISCEQQKKYEVFYDGKLLGSLVPDLIVDG